jgi:hypothetical protein
MLPQIIVTQLFGNTSEGRLQMGSKVGTFKSLVIYIRVVQTASLAPRCQTYD